MFIQLSVNWIRHPFATNSFRITTPEQIRALREAGIQSVRYLPSRSAPDEGEEAVQPAAGPGSDSVGGAGHALPAAASPSGGRPGLPPGLEHQPSALHRCLERYHVAAEGYDRLALDVLAQPLRAREQADDLVDACVQELLGQEPCAIRLLTSSAGDSAAAHAINVMILALLLGRLLGQDAQALQRLGLAALLHDIGKVELPAHIAQPGAPLAAADLQRYQTHVGASVALGQRMGLTSDVLMAMAHHHELADGSGYPLRLLRDDLSREGQILALVNTYDRLCHPLQGQAALTPHEAVSQLYAQHRPCFDSAILGAFIRMMGVYPPGSLVQLVDGRYALVIRVDALHPLRPWVRVHDEHAPELELDLALHPALGIHRSLRPAQLPLAALHALAPQQRIGYYFERALIPPRAKGLE